MLQRTSTCVLIAGLALSALSGCSEDSDSKAVADAAIIMDVTLAENAADSYNEMIRGLNAISSSASAGSVEASAVLLGSAKAGLASTLAESLQAQEFTAREMGALVRATTTQWQRLDAQAKAAAQINVDDELADIARLIGDRRAERETNVQTKADSDARVEELETRIAEFEGKAGEQRNQAGTLQLEISKVSATEAAKLAERIREFTLRADEFDRLASELSTTRDQITPEAREASLNVVMIETQLELLDRQRAEAQAREQAAKEDSVNARRAADLVATELRNLASGLVAYVDGELATAYEGVNREIDAAKQSARQADDIAKNSGSLTVTISLQAKGIIENRRSASLAEASRVFEFIAAAGTISDAATTAESLKTRAIEAHDAAGEAFASAASALRRVRLDSDSGEFRTVSDRLKKAADTLELLSQTPFGEVPDLTVPADESEEAVDDGAFFDDEPSETESEDFDEI